jgi:Protein of unknown function (DUF1475)
MIRFLKFFFLIVLLSMLWVTTWASLECTLWKTQRAVVTHPWFIATLFDTYWGFLTFYCWVCYKETSWLKRVAWLIAILLLGNIAMASYVLNKLFRLPKGASMEDLLLKDKKTS